MRDRGTFLAVLVLDCAIVAVGRMILLGVIGTSFAALILYLKEVADTLCCTAIMLIIRALPSENRPPL